MISEACNLNRDRYGAIILNQSGQQSLASGITGILPNLTFQHVAWSQTLSSRFVICSPTAACGCQALCLVWLCLVCLKWSPCRNSLLGHVLFDCTVLEKAVTLLYTSIFIHQPISAERSLTWKHSINNGQRIKIIRVRVSKLQIRFSLSFQTSLQNFELHQFYKNCICVSSINWKGFYYYYYSL